MKRQLRREERRSDILKSAAGVFSKDGYHKAKMEDISKAAGIGKGTIYLYFESKRQLLKYSNFLHQQDLYRLSSILVK